MSDRTFSTEQVARLAGVSPRTLQYWDERGLLPAVKLKHRRHYTRNDVIFAGVLKAVQRKFEGNAYWIWLIKPIAHKLHAYACVAVERTVSSQNGFTPKPIFLVIERGRRRLKHHLVSREDLLTRVKQMRGGVRVLAVSEEAARIEARLNAS